MEESGAGNLGFELGRHLAGLREAAGLLLGEDDFVVDHDLEDACGPLDELCFDAQLLLDLFRQTGGARVVVSDGAVLDHDSGRHGPISFRRPVYRRPPAALQARNEMAEG